MLCSHCFRCFCGVEELQKHVINVFSASTNCPPAKVCQLRGCIKLKDCIYPGKVVACTLIPGCLMPMPLLNFPKQGTLQKMIKAPKVLNDGDCTETEAVSIFKVQIYLRWISWTAAMHLLSWSARLLTQRYSVVNSCVPNILARKVFQDVPLNIICKFLGNPCFHDSLRQLLSSKLHFKRLKKPLSLSNATLANANPVEH